MFCQCSGNFLFLNLSFDRITLKMTFEFLIEYNPEEAY